MDVGSIASVAMHMSQMQTMSDVGTAVMDMAMEADKVQGANMAAMLESQMTGIGGNVDVRL